jgi:hypothetical protein
MICKGVPVHCGPYCKVLTGNLEGLVILLSCVMQRDREPTLRLALLRTMDAVFEDAARGAAFVPVAGVVVEKLIQESLVWKVGKVAAAVRYAAVVCIGGVLQGVTCVETAGLLITRSSGRPSFCICDYRGCSPELRCVCKLGSRRLLRRLLRAWITALGTI